LLGARLDTNIVNELLSADQRNEVGIRAQRERVKALRRSLATIDAPEARQLEALADYLVRKSVWLVGGDGWAYDIGYGGLDHVLASGRNVNMLVLDTEVYSNTGGQQSKATPLGAVAKFAAAGKSMTKKDLGLLANSYGHVYVARVAMGAKMQQTVQAFLEAEAYPGPSLIIAYSHCIAHGYDMAHGMTQQKLAVDSGVWPLYRFDPRRLDTGEPPLHLDYGPIKARVADYMRNESRFRMVERTNPARFVHFLKQAQEGAQKRYAVYEQLAGVTVPRVEAMDESTEASKAAK
jgi:pyruvate-ferredoxin/flavodoxin oxidoreductase